MRPGKSGGKLFGPVVLIGLGVVFLLHNFGLTDWGPWNLMQRFWPILLVAAGLDIWTGRRSVGGTLGLVLLTVGLLYAIGLGLRIVNGDLPLIWQVVETEIRQPVTQASTAEVSIGLGAGSLKIGPGSPQSANLISGTASLAEGVEPFFYQAKDTAIYRLDSQGLLVPPLLSRWDGEPAWNLQLTPNLPLQLKVTQGVGLSELDLRALKLDSLDLRLGAGQTTVLLPERGQVVGRIDGGVGDVIVQIPDSMAVRIQIKAGLSDIELVADYQVRPGFYQYQSANFETAENRLDLTIHSGVGAVKIVQVEASDE